MAIDPKLIDDLNSRRKKVILSGGQEKIDKRHEKGEMTARDRMGYLFEEGTFSEIGMHVRHNCHNFGMGKKEIPGDGVVSGFGLVNGRPVACAASDFLAQGGSLGYMHAMKIADAQKYALKAGIPMVTVNDSGGARLQEGVAALSGYAQVFYNNVLASGVVPQISMILGPCAGGAAYSPALTDFIIMRNSGNAGMYITGPKVIEQVTYEKCTMDDIGSAAIHASVSGNVHFVADSDAHALDILKRLLSFLPANNAEEPPHKLDTPLDLSADEGMSDLIPGDNRTPLDVQPIISRLVDDGDFLEVHKDFAKNVVVGFGRVCGVVVGIIANQPNVKAGCLDIDSSDKAARFIRFCNAFNIPLVNLVDVPGFLPGKNQERGGIIRHGAKLIFAYSQATVPKVTLIMRKAYGGAYIAMCCKDLGADAVFAWPGAEIAVMGAEGAVPVLYGRELKAVEAPGRTSGRIPGGLLQPVRGGRHGPDHGSHQSGRNPRQDRLRTAHPPEQEGSASGQEARQHSALTSILTDSYVTYDTRLCAGHGQHHGESGLPDRRHPGGHDVPGWPGRHSDHQRLHCRFHPEQGQSQGRSGLRRSRSCACRRPCGSRQAGHDSGNARHPLRSRGLRHDGAHAGNGGRHLRRRGRRPGRHEPPHRGNQAIPGLRLCGRRQGGNLRLPPHPAQSLNHCIIHPYPRPRRESFNLIFHTIHYYEETSHHRRRQGI